MVLGQVSECLETQNKVVTFQGGTSAVIYYIQSERKSLILKEKKSFSSLHLF